MDPPFIWYLLWFLLVWLSLAPRGAQAFRAYDCLRDETKFQEISLIEPERCPKAETDFKSAVNVSVQILQIQDKQHIKGYACDFRRSSTIYRCGLDSLQYPSTEIEKSRHISLGKKQCQRAYEEGKLEYQGRVFEFDRRDHATLSFFEYGSVDEDQSCTTATWTEPDGKKYENSYKTVTLHGHIKPILGERNAGGRDLELQNGVVTEFHAGYVYDRGLGDAIWDTEEPECDETVSQVFAGQMELFERKGPVDGDLSEAIGLLDEGDLMDDRQVAALVFRDPIRVCGQLCYTTQVEHLVACTFRGYETIPERAHHSHFDQSDISFAVRHSNGHIRTSQRLEESLASVTEQLCNVDYRINAHLLASLSGANNEHSMMAALGEGSQVTPAGAIFYVEKCQAVEVKRVDFPNCTQEVPIQVISDNSTRTRFMDSITKIITDIPTILKCDRIMPIKWFIEGQWWCSTPLVHACDPPKQLPVNVAPFAPESYTDYLGHDVYSGAQREAHEVASRARRGRPGQLAALTNRGVTTGAVNDKGVFTLGSELSKAAQEAASEFTMKRFFGGFYTLGEWSIFFCGIVAAFAWVATCANSTARIHKAYRLRGNTCGLWVIGSAFECIFSMFFLPKVIMDAISKNLETNEAWERLAGLVTGGHGRTGDGSNQPPPPPSAPSAPPAAQAARADDCRLDMVDLLKRAAREMRMEEARDGRAALLPRPEGTRAIATLYAGPGAGGVVTTGPGPLVHFGTEDERRRPHYTLRRSMGLEMSRLQPARASQRLPRADASADLLGGVGAAAADYPPPLPPRAVAEAAPPANGRARPPTTGGGATGGTPEAETPAEDSELNPRYVDIQDPAGATAPPGDSTALVSPPGPMPALEQRDGARGRAGQHHAPPSEGEYAF